MAVNFDINNRMVQNSNVLTQYQNALESAVTYRCSSISQILSTASLKELKFIFPKLVEDIFGFHTRIDWGFTSTLSSNDFHALRAFLAPDGPLLICAYKLLNDHHPNNFEFPISCLPFPSRQHIENGDIPPFYVNKVHKIGDHLARTIELNSFQLYLFHFAYFIVRPPTKYMHDSLDQYCKSLYSHLLEDYLPFFLPTEGYPAPLPIESSTPPSPPSPFRNTDWPSQLSSGFSNFCGTPIPNPSSVPKYRPGLFKAGIDVMLNDSPNTSGVHSSNPPTKIEDWRSEEFIGILAEMYLNQLSSDFTHSRLSMEYCVPNYYHTWMVRILVKHAHFYSNSLLTSNHLIGQSPLVIDPMRHLKSTILPRYIQKEMHVFLKLIFDTWPLDSSFHFPLEMWLSYIQPWRYIHMTILPEVDRLTHKWQKFVTDNLYFYTSIFLKVLQRFSRMDLTCPRNSYMLFRVCKVFARENLSNMIVTAEQNSQTTSRRTMNWPFSPTISSFTTSSPLHGYQQEFTAGDAYIPFFSEIVIAQVSHLLKEIMYALEKSKVQTSSQDKANEGFFSQFISLFAMEGNISDYWLSDVKKLTAHLESASENLCKLFQLSPPSMPQKLINQSSLGASSSFLYGDQGMSQSNLWAMNDKISPNVPVTGNPDNQPVRTYEFQFLVKMFADISDFANKKYSQQIQELYQKSSLLGRICRQCLAPPTTYYNTVKSSDMMSVKLQPMDLPPRVCLRNFASKNRVIMFLLYLMILYFFNYHVLSSVMILIGITFVVVLVKALFYSVPPVPNTATGRS